MTKRNRTSRCPFVLGQKKSCPVVSLSLDKDRSKNLQTNSSIPSVPWFVPRQDGTDSQNPVPWQNFIILASPGPSHGEMSKSRPSSSHMARFWACPIVPLSWVNEVFSVPFVPRGKTVPSQPIPRQDFEIVLLSLCPGTMKNFLSLLSLETKMSHHVGNPTF